MLSRKLPENRKNNGAMIVRMKEILLFTSAQSTEETIHALGNLGVVDIVEISQPENGTTAYRQAAVRDTEAAISLLGEHTATKTTNHPIKYPVDDPKQLVQRVLAASGIREKVAQRLEELRALSNWYETWGREVSVPALEDLAEAGLYIRLYLLTPSQQKDIPGRHTVISFPKQGDLIPVALIARDEREKLPWKEEPLPELSYASVVQQIQRKERQLAEVERFFRDHTNNISWLEEYLLVLRDQLAMRQVLAGMGDINGKVQYLKGFIPKKEVDTFKAEAEANHWGYVVQDPENPEEVPVYIKNPKWVKIINPVMSFIDIVPGYKEVDVSIYFLVAFALFFAMLVGDAGYGLVFLLVALLLRKKLSSQVRVLIYVLSCATILWGVLSGTYFGSEAIAALPVLNDLIIPEIASFGVDNISFMMHLSFLIGAIHLTVAHGIRVIMFINSLRAFSELGWIALVWSLFFITEQLVLGIPMPSWGIWLLAGGVSLVALFSRESNNFFKSILVSLANLPLSLISGFSDIVSYVRLFAVGLATAAVASSFNNMIVPEGIAGMGFIQIVLAAFALLLGHGLNIALALMAVMVHGIRLNMLEFSGHLGVQFSGEAYSPFRWLSNAASLPGKRVEPLKKRITY
jgi:V/A-type H+-transporting ATPase subunit I